MLMYSMIFFDINFHLSILLFSAEGDCSFFRQKSSTRYVAYARDPSPDNRAPWVYVLFIICNALAECFMEESASVPGAGTPTQVWRLNADYVAMLLHIFRNSIIIHFRVGDRMTDIDYIDEGQNDQRWGIHVISIFQQRERNNETISRLISSSFLVFLLSISFTNYRSQ